MPVALRALLMVLVMSFSLPAAAQPYPSKTVRFVVPFSASGITDVMARLIGQHLSDTLGQPFVVENRAGAAGIGGTEIVAKAPADGHTLLMTNISFTVNPALYAKLPYDSLKDFTPVTMVNSAPLVLVVNPSVPAKSVKELVALAKARPGDLTYGSGGIGSTPYLAAELFKSLAGIDMLHVPYKGFQDSSVAVIGGHVGMLMDNIGNTMALVKAGKLRALAVTSAQRSFYEPDLPTLAEAGVPGYEIIGWNGMMVVSGTPRPIVDKLHAETAKFLQSPEMKKRLADQGSDAIGNKPEEFGQFIRAEMARWGKMIKDKGIQAK